MYILLNLLLLSHEIVLRFYLLSIVLENLVYEIELNKLLICQLTLFLNFYITIKEA